MNIKLMSVICLAFRVSLMALAQSPTATPGPAVMDATPKPATNNTPPLLPTRFPPGSFFNQPLADSGTLSANADELDVLVNTYTSDARRGEAYDKLTKVEFSSIAAKLARLMGTHLSFLGLGLGPQTKQPWLESRLSEGNRISFTLRQLWGVPGKHLEDTRRDS
jgi:hypothetical protein